MGQRLEVESSDLTLHAAVVHAANPDEAEELKEIVLSRFQPGEFYLTELSATLGTDPRPRALGPGWYMG